MKEKIKQWFITWKISIIFASIITLLIYLQIYRYKENLSLNSPIQKILISSMEIKVGTILDESMIIVKEMPETYIPPQALYEKDISSILGTQVHASISNGEILTTNMLETDTVQSSTYSSKIKDGYRAISIDITLSSSVSNFVQEGDHVDLLVTDQTKKNPEQRTYTFMQDIEVLYVGSNQIPQENGQTYSNITFMVKPQEVPIIEHSIQLGKVTLSLRGNSDHSHLKNLPIVTQEDIIGRGYSYSRSRSEGSKIEILKNMQKEKIEFEFKN